MYFLVILLKDKKADVPIRGKSYDYVLDCHNRNAEEFIRPYFRELGISFCTEIGWQSDMKNGYRYSTHKVELQFPTKRAFMLFKINNIGYLENIKEKYSIVSVYGIET